MAETEAAATMVIPAVNFDVDINTDQTSFVMRYTPSATSIVDFAAELDANDDGSISVDENEVDFVSRYIAEAPIADEEVPSIRIAIDKDQVDFSDRYLIEEAPES